MWITRNELAQKLVIWKRDICGGALFFVLVHHRCHVVHVAFAAQPPGQARSGWVWAALGGGTEFS